MLKYKIVLLAVLMQLSLSVFGQNVNDDAAQEQKTFRIAFSQESYPHQFIDDQGQPAGIMVEFWELWAQLQDVDVVFVPYLWADSLAAVENGLVDFHAGMSVVEERKKRFSYSHQALAHVNYIYVNTDTPSVTSIDELSPYTIGAVKGSSHVPTIRALSDSLNVRLFPSRSELYDAALNKEILAFASVDTLEREYERINELHELFPKYRRLTSFEGDYSAAINPNKLYLADFINQGLAKINQQQKEKIYNRWTKESKRTEALQLVFSSGLPPYMAMSPSGKAQGLFIDIWKLWSEVTGIDVEFIPETMSGSIDAVHREIADAHLAYPEKKPSTTGLRIASHVYTSTSQVFVSKSVESVDSVEDLQGKKVGMFVTSPYIDIFKQTYPKVRIVEFITPDKMLQAIEQGQIDAMVSEVEGMNVKLVNANLQSSFFLLDEPVFKNNMYSLVKPENPQMAKIIAEGFKLITVDKLQQLERNWLVESSAAHFNRINRKVNLDDEELHFLSQHEKFVVGIASDWEPVEFVNAQGEPDGVNRDFLIAIAERAGFNVEFKAFDSYDELYQAFVAQEIDIIAGLSETPGRKENAVFSTTYWDMPWAVLHSSFLESQQSIKDFYGKQLAMVKGYNLTNVIRREHPQINISVVENVEQGLIAVQQGLVDGFVETLPVLSKLAKRENVLPLSLSVLEEIPIESNKIAVGKQNAILANIINKALMAIEPAAKRDIFDKWFDVNIKTGFDKRFVTKVAAQFGIFIFIVIFVIAVWNRKLRQEINLRKSLEQKMKHMATHDELTGVANRILLKQQIIKSISMHQRQELKLALLFVDLDGFKKVNDSFGHEAGDKVLVDVAQRLEICVRQSDIVARFGGDEFVVLITGIHSKQESTYIADKIINTISQPYLIGQDEVTLGCSIGIAVYPEDGQSESELLNTADNLMYRVKTSGKNNFAIR